MILKSDPFIKFCLTLLTIKRENEVDETDTVTTRFQAKFRNIVIH